MPIDYSKQRKRVTPPHVSLKALRLVSGMTLDRVCELANETNPALALKRGSLSAIESGTRGASTQVLAALELAYGLPEGEISTSYEPKTWLRAS